MLKVQIKKEDFVVKTLQVLKSLACRNVFPVMHNVVLEVKDGVLSLFATDLETSLFVTFPEISAEGEGKALLPADKLSDIIARSKSGVVLELKKEKAVLKSKEAVFELPVGSLEDYPSYTIPKKEGASCTVSGKELFYLFDCTSFAVGDKKADSVFQGIHLKKDKEILQAEATNRHMLARASVPVKENVCIDCAVMLPTFKLASNFFKESEKVEIFQNEKQIVFRSGGNIIWGQVIEGAFPDTSFIFESESSAAFEISKKDFEDALRQAAIVAPKSNNQVALDISNHSVSVKAQSESGKVLTSLPQGTMRVLSGNEKSFKIGFNYAYLLSVLDKCGEKAKMRLKSSKEPAFVEYESFCCAIMPQVITEEE